MKKIILYLLLITFLCFGLFSWFFGGKMNQELTPEDRVLYGFIVREGKLLGKKYGMSLVSLGGGTKDQKIWLMSFDFQRYGPPLSEEETRRLIIGCLHDYLEAVNSDEALKPFLRDYPFTPKNINMGIFNSGVDKREVFYPSISVVTASEGLISFFTHDQLRDVGYKTEKYETYEEAIEILEKEKENVSTEIKSQ